MIETTNVDLAPHRAIHRKLGALALILAAPAGAATLAVGNQTNLDNSLFTTAAVVTGGNDLSSNTGNLATAYEITSGGTWASDGSETVSITGVSLPIWANSANTDGTNNTQNGTFSFTFYSLGASADVGANYAGNTLIGTATATFASANTGVSAFFVNFDSPVVWTAADSTAFSVQVTNTAAIRLKTGPTNAGVPIESVGNGNTNGALMSIAVAGTVAPIPEPSTLMVLPLAGLALLRRRR